MNARFVVRTLVLILVLAASLGAVRSDAQTEGAQERPLNRFGLSYRAGFNIDAGFTDLRQIPSRPDPGPAQAGVDHNYDDGYVRVDISGNANNQTWYWGYQEASQVPGDGFIYMHSASVSREPFVGDVNNDPQHGFEITYSRELGKIGRVYWGLEGAANYTDVFIRDQRFFAGTRSLLTDAYSLGGVVPPALPYNGSFEGPGPVISDVPNRVIEQAGAQVYRSIEADLWGLRVGPYMEVPLSRSLSATLNGGFAMAVVNSRFSYRDTIGAIGSLAPVQSSGSGREEDVLLGGYVGGAFSYRLTEAFSVSTGVQFQKLGTFSQQVLDKQAELDLRNSIFLTLAFGYAF